MPKTNMICRCGIDPNYPVRLVGCGAVELSNETLSRDAAAPADGGLDQTMQRLQRFGNPERIRLKPRLCQRVGEAGHFRARIAPERCEIQKEQRRHGRARMLD